MARTHKDQKEWSRSGWYGKCLKFFCKTWWGSERAKVRDTLRKGEQPDPTRTRSSVKWDIS